VASSGQGGIEEPAVSETDNASGGGEHGQAWTAGAVRLVIEPTHGLRALDLRELVLYRELLYFLCWRDLKVRYRQTAVGVAWVVLQPLLLMLVFSLFFGKWAKLEQGLGVPYPLFALAGLLPWQLFSRALTDSSSSLVRDQRMITKVYFPRIIVPLASCLSATVDFIIGVVLLVLAMLWFRAVPPLAVLWLPAFLVLLLVAAAGVGFWFSALNTEYRDVMYAMPFVVQFWMFVTPVVYPTTVVPPAYRWLLGLNPMAGVVEGFRWCLFGAGAGPGPGALLWVSALVAAIAFVTGIAWFRVRERRFVDTLGGQ
jgi:lipopolysaccharide transport system permease protein